MVFNQIKQPYNEDKEKETSQTIENPVTNIIDDMQGEESVTDDQGRIRNHDRNIVTDRLNELGEMQDIDIGEDLRDTTTKVKDQFQETRINLDNAMQKAQQTTTDIGKKGVEMRTELIKQQADAIKEITGIQNLGRKTTIITGLVIIAVIAYALSQINRLFGR